MCLNGNGFGLMVRVEARFHLTQFSKLEKQ